METIQNWPITSYRIPLEGVCAISQIDFIDLITEKEPREILEEDFPRLGPLPFRGGWGYDENTACIIDLKDPRMRRVGPGNDVRYEYIFAEYRVYEELIVFRPPEQRYAGISLKLIEQEFRPVEGRKFDVLRFHVTALLENEFFRLKEVFEGPNGIRSPDFDAEAHERIHNSHLRTATREYWFDTTDFFRKN